MGDGVDYDGDDDDADDEDWIERQKKERRKGGERKRMLYFGAPGTVCPIRPTQATDDQRDGQPFSVTGTLCFASSRRRRHG